MGRKSERVPPELEDVANQIGEFIEYWGFKNVHGRIWAHIYLSPTPLDASQLIDRLGISKALASMSLSDLLSYEVIQTSGKSDRGTVTYEANPRIMSVITNVLRKRERRMLGRISAATRLLKDLPADEPRSREERSAKLQPERVRSLIEMVTAAESCLDGMLSMGDVDFRRFSAFNKPLRESEA